MIRWLALPATLALAACGSAQGQGVPQAASPYVATAVGRIDSLDEARELVAAADGVIARVLVGRGDKVRAGQVLSPVSTNGTDLRL